MVDPGNPCCSVVSSWASVDGFVDKEETSVTPRHKQIQLHWWRLRLCTPYNVTRSTRLDSWEPDRVPRDLVSGRRKEVVGGDVMRSQREGKFWLECDSDRGYEQVEFRYIDHFQPACMCACRKSRIISTA